MRVAAAARGWRVALDELPTMFRRDPAATWEAALEAAGFERVDVREEEAVTTYADAPAAARRLLAAWPPILSGHVPDAEIDALVTAAARAMMDSDGVMTSRLLEFSAFESGVPEPFRGRSPPARRAGL